MSDDSKLGAALDTEEGRKKLGEAFADLFHEARKKAFLERFSRPPSIIPEGEVAMSMEKRGVVETEHEKKAHEKVKTEHEKKEPTPKSTPPASKEQK